MAAADLDLRLRAVFAYLARHFWNHVLCIDNVECFSGLTGQTLKDDEVLGWVIDLHYIDDLVLVGNFEWKVDFAQFTIQLFEF